MVDSHDYHVDIVNTGDKTGIAASASDELPKLEIASPPEFGGPPATWSPEHLFVAAISSCLMTTFMAIAEITSLDVVAYNDRATGHLQRGDDKLYSIDRVTLRPTVQVAEPKDVQAAIDLLHRADEICLISRSTNTDVVLDPVIEVAHPIHA